MTDVESSGPQRAPVPAAQGTPVALVATGPSPPVASDLVQDNGVVVGDALGTNKDQGVTSTLPTVQESTTSDFDPADPMHFGRHRRDNISNKQMKVEHPEGNKRKLKKYYSRQDKLINQSLELRMKSETRWKKMRERLALFATAADAFMDLVSSFVMLITSRFATRPSIYKYPAGRKRIETLRIILFCALMTTVSIQLPIESARNLGSGDKTNLRVLISFHSPLWVSPVSTKHHVMDEDTPLRISHDVGQMLQRKLEGLALVERAFVHVDYEHAHNIHEEHKPVYEKSAPKRSLKDILLFRKSAMEQGEANASTGR
ncbi:putative cation efflux family protein [Pseudoneurospora amorphoporcata]|uniref:Cation efflux family protein n=1 Tax=Pseudoneurospora amorphoporcata TaxID=241081 RepID=A0AAN6P4R5_9PEZI|nr:putative cation efflux family protein [Pseudoneurospora amorphoporcata]